MARSEGISRVPQSRPSCSAENEKGSGGSFKRQNRRGSEKEETREQPDGAKL
jgi:hypothetical protein